MPIVIDYAQENTPISVDVIITRCGILLLDEEHIRWPKSELIDWINEGIGEIINLRPAAGSKTAVMPLVAEKNRLRNLTEGLDKLSLSQLRNLSV